MQKKQTAKNKGYTLIELLVVMSVFLLVIGAAIAIFISIVENQREVLAKEELINQMSYVQERMSKALRMAKKDSDGSCIEKGYNYQLSPRLNSNSFGIAFLNSSYEDEYGNPVCEEFYLSGTTIYEKKWSQRDEKPNDSDDVAMTSQNVKVNSLMFGINGCNGGSSCDNNDSMGGDGTQARVTISMDVQTPGLGDQPRLNLQTTVSQRNMNVQ